MNKYLGQGMLVACLVFALLCIVPISSNANSEPQIVTVDSTTPDGAYKADTTIAISVKFNQVVTVDGSPSIALNSGGTANYTLGSGTDTLVFTYVPKSSENSLDLELSSANAITLNGGSIIDASNALSANLSTSLPALSAVKNLVIDTIAPTKPVFTLTRSVSTNEVTVSISYPSDTVDTQFQLWGDNRATYTGPFILNSNRTISAYAMDSAGNTSEEVVSVDLIPPIVKAKIRGGVHATYSNVVQLEITDQSGDATQMQFSDDNDIWSDWESYNLYKTYTLPLGAGLKTIYVRTRDGAGNWSEVYPVSINLLESSQEMNLALYSSVTGYPQVTTSYSCCVDNGQNTVNGLYDYSGGAHDRWTNYGGNASDYLIYDFGEPKSFNQIKLYLYNDGGGVQLPSSYAVQYWVDHQWVDMPNQNKKVETPQIGTSNDGAIKENSLSTVNFDLISTDKIKITMNNGNAFVGFVEMEVFLHIPIADALAAGNVQTAIQNLPAAEDVRLSDSGAIQAARSAYDLLTVSQKTLVTLLERLVQAETVLQELEALLSDVAVHSAFSSETGYEVTLKVASPLDSNYELDSSLFHIHAQGEAISVSEAYIDYSDSSYQTIKLILSSHLQLGATTVTIDIQRGAFRTSQSQLNTTISDFPIIPFNVIDVTGDHQISIGDIAEIVSNAVRHVDVNQDGVFDREDVMSLLSQISPASR